MTNVIEIVQDNLLNSCKRCGLVDGYVKKESFLFLKAFLLFVYIDAVLKPFQSCAAKVDCNWL